MMSSPVGRPCPGGAGGLPGGEQAAQNLLLFCHCHHLAYPFERAELRLEALHARLGGEIEATITMSRAAMATGKTLGVYPRRLDRAAGPRIDGLL
jgi:hypothetical protein